MKTELKDLAFSTEIGYDKLTVHTSYIRQGGYLFTCVCLSVLTRLLENYWSHVYDILQNGWT